MKWFIKCLKQYADFKGRARRKEYWWFVVFNFIFTMVLLISLLVQMFTLGWSEPGVTKYEVAARTIKSPFLWLYLLFYVAMFLPGLAVSVRRLHDIGRSGWWVLLLYSGSIFNVISRMVMETNLLAFLLIALLMMAIWVISLVWLFTDSQPGENQWGPNPKEPQSQTTENQQ